MRRNDYFKEFTILLPYMQNHVISRIIIMFFLGGGKNTDYKNMT